MAPQSREQRKASGEARGEARGESFRKVRNAQAGYARQLRQLARHVAATVKAFTPEDETAALSSAAQARIREALAAYAKAIAPWARTTAAKMIAQVNRRDQTAWQRYTEGMSAALRAELRNAPTGEEMARLLEEQVTLITSLPLDAAQRIHERTAAALEHGSRYPDQVAEIEAMLAEAHPAATEEWTLNRATLIARTETARTASVLTQARAQHIGADEYVWRTAGDARVRESHRKLNGTTQRWDDPPLSDPPDNYSHPGQIWNCRCVALPILSEH